MPISCISLISNATHNTSLDWYDPVISFSDSRCPTDSHESFDGRDDQNYPFFGMPIALILQ